MKIAKILQKIDFILLIICVLNITLHILIYGLLPDTIPIHWGSHGIVDGYGPKYMDLLLGALPLGVFGIMHLMAKIDPKAANYAKFKSVWEGFLFGIIVFMIFISWCPELVVFGIVDEQSGVISFIVYMLIGVMLILIGKYMPKIKQNNTFGIKTPWALKDEENWRKTHEVGGIVFMIMGILTIGVGLWVAAYPGYSVLNVLLVILIGGVGLTYLYSYLLDKEILE